MRGQLQDHLLALTELVVPSPADAGSVTEINMLVLRGAGVSTRESGVSYRARNEQRNRHRGVSTRKSGVSYRAPVDGVPRVWCIHPQKRGQLQGNRFSRSSTVVSTRESGVSYRTARQTNHMATRPVIGHKTHHHPMSPEGEKRKKTEKLPPKNFRGAKISATENTHTQNSARERNLTT